MGAGLSGNPKMSLRDERALKRLFSACVNDAAQDILAAALERFGQKSILEECPEQVLSSEQALLATEPGVVATVEQGVIATVDQQVIATPEQRVIATTEPGVIVTPISSFASHNRLVLKDDNVAEVLEFDDSGAEDDTTTNNNEFLNNLKEEVVLQLLLYKRIHDKRERVFELKHRNGRRLLVVLPPDTQAGTTFDDEARKTNWVQIMLNTDERVEGMLLHLAKSHPKTFIKVGHQRRLSTTPLALTTVQTMALGRVAGLNDVRLKKLRSFLRQVAGINIQLAQKEIDRIDIQVGLHRTKEAIFGSHLHQWSQSKGKEKKPPELVHFWNCDLANEIEAVVDLYLRHLLLAAADDDAESETQCTIRNAVDGIPSLDYVGDGFVKPGVTLLFGGDHGDRNCPISCKINLSPPTVRKEMKMLGFQCPLICFASIQCTTDAYDLMDATVMPLVKQQLTSIKESAVVTVYHRKNWMTAFRSYVVPNTIRPATLAFSNGANVEGQSPMIQLSFAYGNEGDPLAFGSHNIDDPVFQGAQWFELGAKVVITTFNELFIGDLAFLAMLIGMNHSSASHDCLLCLAKASQFNCNHQKLTMRTKESLRQCCEEYMLIMLDPKRRTPPNYQGVNGKGLVDIDPQRIIIPILHCPMGLVDKVLESFKNWVNLEVEDFHDNETEGVRRVLKQARQRHAAAIAAHQQAKDFFEENPTMELAKGMVETANRERINTKRDESKAKKEFDEIVQRHNAKSTSLNQQFETIFRRNGVIREYYHGGKFNGVNCIRVMEKSNDLLLGEKDATNPVGFLQKCLLSKTPTTTDQDVISKCTEYCRLLGLLDTIWSTVRGLDAGLLPTDKQIQYLDEALKQGKTLWLAMGLSTLQPKWHLTFDGHLFAQFKKYGGLADKSDETIEKGHQTLKTNRARFRGIGSYAQQETCIRRELSRARSPEIQRHIDKHQAMIKQAAGTKRAKETAERQDNNKKAKKEKRDSYIVTL